MLRNSTLPKVFWGNMGGADEGGVGNHVGIEETDRGMCWVWREWCRAGCECLESDLQEYKVEMVAGTMVEWLDQSQLLLA